MAERFSNRPSFAENYDRGAQRHSDDASDGDPLAELARLIGQTDPQSDFARGRQTNQPPAPRSLATDFSAGRPSWLQTAQAQQTRAQPPHAEHQPQHGVEDEPELTPMPAFLQAQQAQHAQHSQHMPQTPPDRYDQVLYGQDQPQQYEEYDEQQEYDDEQYSDEQFEGQPGFLETENKRRRPGGLLTVAVVLGLAVVGTAGAYAYRSYSGSPRSGTPPVIKADTAPSKVVPPTQSGDGSGKLIYDRIGNAGGPERVVSREEQPVDVNANVPRSAFPAVGQGSASQQQGSAPADDGADSPRKIRTVPIRGDQANGAPPAARQVPPAPAAVRTVPVQAAAPAQPAPNAPVSLSPNAPAAPSNVRAASAAVPPQASAGPSSVTHTTGGYLVQISSQRSEADAQASYRAAQAKYANLIGSMSPIIKRADLGDKGIYYRAMVGPFQTSDEATRFCSNLKVAGGSCVVQRN